jgi:hypothetical protein
MYQEKMMTKMFVVVKKNNPVTKEELVQDAFRLDTREEAEAFRKQLAESEEYEVREIEV